MSTPLRTEKERDRNYLSLNSDSVVLYAGTTDERQLEPGEEIPKELVPSDPKAWESLLKCSGRTGTVLWGMRVAQGKENTGDFNNRTANCVFSGSWGVTGTEGEQVFTIKGGTHHLTLGGTVHSRGRRGDIVIGTWSDQSFDPSHTIDLSGLKHDSGRVLTVVLGRVNNPLVAALGRPKDIILPSNAKVLFWRSLGTQVHWWAKWVGVKVGLIKGVKQV